MSAMHRVALAAPFLLWAAAAAAQPAAPAGSAERGKPLYLSYGCYACHGYNAQTGNGPRLQPPRLNATQFQVYIRAPRTMQMPAYTVKVLSDVEAADIYAYVTSLPREPEVKDVPLLRQLSPDARVPRERADIFTGTWKLNVAKSQMQPATASRSEIIHYRVIGNEEDFLSEAVTADGQPESIKYTAFYDDGKGYPFSVTIGGKLTNPGALTMVRRIDAWTRERYNVRDGKPVLASRRVLSKDGRTMTLTILRVDSQGRETVNESRILERQVRLLSSNGVRVVVEGLADDLDRAVGSGLSADFSSTATLQQRILNGEAFDVAILTTDAIDDLVKAGRLHPSSRVELARTGVGVGFRKGGRRPDVRTAAALKQSLLEAPSIVYASAGASRAAIDRMLNALGIAAALEARTTLVGPGQAVDTVATGKSAIVITLVSEILPVPGVELAGPLPGEFQSYVSFAAATPDEERASHATALHGLLGGPRAAQLLKRNGLEPR